MRLSLCVVLVFVVHCWQNANGQLVSPCPRLFTYEPQKENDRWYGLVTLLSESDLSGTWLRLIFDRPSLQLGNWFGEVSTTDNKEYLLKNRNNMIKANMPQTLRFYVKYDPSQPAPMLLSFRLNAKTVCPEQTAVESAPTTSSELQTSNPLGSTEIPAAVTGGGAGVGGTIQRPSLGGQGAGPGPAPPQGGGGSFGPLPGGGGGGGDDDDFFQGDFNLFNRPNSNPGLGLQDIKDVNAICGTIAAQPRPLITYGQATHEGQFPWHAALYHAKGIDLAYICGASLVSKFHVITVAHCVTKRRTAQALSPDSLVVYLGKYYLKRWSNPGIQDHQVASIIPHPKYDPQTYKNDISLIKLSSVVDFTDYVRPICLWNAKPDLSNIINQGGTVVGWGFDETGKVTEQLMQAQMPVVSHETCIFSFPEFFSRFTSRNTFCAGFRNGTSVCNGDSGGGMVFPRPGNPNRPVFQLRGLVSISVALQNQFKCDSTHYVIFTDIAQYLDWIKQTLNM